MIGPQTGVWQARQWLWLPCRAGAAPFPAAVLWINVAAPARDQFLNDVSMLLAQSKRVPRCP